MPRPHHFIGSDAVQQGARHGLNTDQLPAKFPAHQYSIFLRGIVKILPDAILHKPLLFIEGACRRVALPHIQKYFIDFSFSRDPKISAAPSQLQQPHPLL